MTTPELPAPVLASTAGEREVLVAFLDFQRSVVRRKALGVSEQDARRRLVPSLTTLAGLVRHLTAVERNWFQGLLAGGPIERGAGTWHVGDDETVVDLLAAYDEACARSRELAAGLALDHVVPQPELGQVSLRWILVHLIEETARHAGHADILREQLDGSTGVLG